MTHTIWLAIALLTGYLSFWHGYDRGELDGWKMGKALPSTKLEKSPNTTYYFYRQPHKIGSKKLEWKS